MYFSINICNEDHIIISNYFYVFLSYLVLLRNLSNFCSLASVLTMFFGSSFPVFADPDFPVSDDSEIGAVAPGINV